MIDGADFYKWMQVFGLAEGGGSGATAFGEFMIINNLRPTFFSVVSSAWVKIEAGNAAAAPTPPLYNYYAPGNCYNWGWDAVNARLVYTGPPGYQRISGHLNMSIGPGGSPTQIYASVLMNGDQSGVQNTLANTALNMIDTPLGEFAAISVGATVYCVPGDYIEAVVKNITNTSSVIVRYLNISAVGLKSFPAPISLANIVDEAENPLVDESQTQIAAETSA